MRILSNSTKLGKVNVNVLQNELNNCILRNQRQPVRSKCQSNVTYVRKNYTQLVNEISVAAQCSNGIVPRSVQNVVDTPLCLSPVISASSKKLPSINTQHIIMPCVNATDDRKAMLKPATTCKPYSNGNPRKTANPPGSIKSVQLPADFLQTGRATLVKGTTNFPVLLKTVDPTANVPVLVKATSVLKNQEHKPITMKGLSVLRSTGANPAGSVSVLKSQVKTQSGITSDGSMNAQNVVMSFSNLPQNGELVQQTAASSQIRPNGQLKSSENFINGNIIKAIIPNATAPRVIRLVQRPRIVNQDAVVKTTEQTDPSRPLGSCENPIQILQEGQSFRSSQLLSQTQWKNIAQLLQQRNQAHPLTKENIMYR